MSNEVAVRLVPRKTDVLLSTENCCLSALDQLAKDFGFGSWELFKTFSIKTSPLVWKATQRAAELGFEAGQKQEQSRCEGIVNEEIERVVNKYGLKKRLFSEGGK